MKLEQPSVISFSPRPVVTATRCPHAPAGATPLDADCGCLERLCGYLPAAAHLKQPGWVAPFHRLRFAIGDPGCGALGEPDSTEASIQDNFY